MAKKVLVVDDEKLIVKGIRFSLEQDGMEVDCAYDGEEALKMATENHYDMILLDIMLPKMDGFEVCQHIREFSDMPIVMLTAKGDDMDKILGLEYGADDYITKPFNILEVKARIKAIMRRTAGSQPKKEDSKVIEAGDLRLDCESRRLFILNKEVNLTAKEFDLLELLVNNPNKVYSRENLQPPPHGDLPAAEPLRRGRVRSRRAVVGLPAAEAFAADRRRRGARRQLQADGACAALQRPRLRRGDGAPDGRPDAAGQRHAVARNMAQRRVGQIRARGAD